MYRVNRPSAFQSSTCESFDWCESNTRSTEQKSQPVCVWWGEGEGGEGTCLETSCRMVLGNSDLDRGERTFKKI